MKKFKRNEWGDSEQRDSFQHLGFSGREILIQTDKVAYDEKSSWLFILGQKGRGDTFEGYADVFTQEEAFEMAILLMNYALHGNFNRIKEEEDEPTT